VVVGCNGKRLTVGQVLKWADAHRARTGGWPTVNSGAIPEAPGQTWNAVNLALRQGYRGLAGGSSLARLLAARRHKRGRYQPLTVQQILRWADAFRRRTGGWPRQQSGSVDGVPGLCWRGVDDALRFGYRGLPGGESVARLLARQRGARNSADVPRLTVRQVLAWADAQHAVRGVWPTAHAGPLTDVPDESWGAINMALYKGRRGLKGGDSLAKLLERHRGVRRWARQA
jgi:hypothetical protein